METEHTSNTISRREILKRGAFVGGAVLWVTPVVQAVGMGRAYAKDVSDGCTRYCIKWDVDANGETGETTCADPTNRIHAYPIRGSAWEEIGARGKGHSDDDDHDTGTILTCPDDGVRDAKAARDITTRNGAGFVVYGTQQDGFWIAFPRDIKIADLKDEGNDSIGAKCGTVKVTFDSSIEDDPCLKNANGPYRRIHIRGCSNSKDISHIELIVDWCPNGSPS